MKGKRSGVMRGLQAAGRRLAVWLVPWGAVVLAPLLLLGPAVARGEVLFWGTPLLQFVPWRTYALEVVNQGYLPLWNPLVGMGAPLLANYQSALLYPPNWLLALLGVAWGHGILVILHWILAGLGMALLSRQLGMRPLSAAIASLAYALSGYLVARAGFFSINAATAWVPWILVGIEGTFADGKDRRQARNSMLVLAGAFSLQWLAGHAQTAWYTVLLALAWWLWRALSSVGWRRLPALAPSLVLPATLAFLLSAPQLLPTLEYLANSERAAALDPELALTYSFWPWRILELVAPGVFGHPASGDYWGYANYWEDAIYIGVLPFLLAVGGVVAAVRGKGKRPDLGRFLLGVLSVGLVLGLGKNTPVFPWLFEHIPTFDLFQAPTRWNLLLVFSLSLLAGLGAERWRPVEGWGLYWTRLGTAGAGAIVAGALLAPSLLEGVRPTFLAAFAATGLWLLLAGILTLFQRRKQPAWWQLAVVTVVAADLLLASARLNPTTGKELYEGRSKLSQENLGSHRFYLAPEAEYDLKFYDSFRFDTFNALEDWRRVRDWGLPNTTMLEGIRSANNFDPLLPGRYERWLLRLSQIPAARQPPKLALMDVGRAQLAVPEGVDPEYDAVSGPARARWYRGVTRVSNPAEALEAAFESEFDPSTTLILEGGAASLPSPADGRIVSVRDLGPNVVEVDVAADGEGWVMLADVHYPGWRAMVDGHETIIIPANSVFRAVRVPAGEHTVRFEYRPLSFRAGLILFGLGALALVVIRWRRR